MEVKTRGPDISFGGMPGVGAILIRVLSIFGSGLLVSNIVGSFMTLDSTMRIFFGVVGVIIGAVAVDRQGIERHV